MVTGCIVWSPGSCAAHGTYRVVDAHCRLAKALAGPRRRCGLAHACTRQRPPTAEGCERAVVEGRLCGCGVVVVWLVSSLEVVGDGAEQARDARAQCGRGEDDDQCDDGDENSVLRHCLTLLTVRPSNQGAPELEKAVHHRGFHPLSIPGSAGWPCAWADTAVRHGAGFLIAGLSAMAPASARGGAGHQRQTTSSA